MRRFAANRSNRQILNHLISPSWNRLLTQADLRLELIEHLSLCRGASDWQGKLGGDFPAEQIIGRLEKTLLGATRISMSQVVGLWNGRTLEVNAESGVLSFRYSADVIKAPPLPESLSRGTPNAELSLAISQPRPINLSGIAIALARAELPHLNATSEARSLKISARLSGEFPAGILENINRYLDELFTGEFGSALGLGHTKFRVGWSSANKHEASGGGVGAIDIEIRLNTSEFADGLSRAMSAELEEIVDEK